MKESNLTNCLVVEWMIVATPLVLYIREKLLSRFILDLMYLDNNIVQIHSFHNESKKQKFFYIGPEGVLA
jgi:hypothetical protein